MTDGVVRPGVCACVAARFSGDSFGVSLSELPGLVVDGVCEAFSGEIGVVCHLAPPALFASGSARHGVSPEVARGARRAVEGVLSRGGRLPELLEILVSGMRGFVTWLTGPGGQNYGYLSFFPLSGAEPVEFRELRRLSRFVSEQITGRVVLETSRLSHEIFMRSESGIVVTDARRRVLAWNPAFAGMLGGSCAGVRLGDLFFPESISDARKLVRALREGDDWSGRMRGRGVCDGRDFGVSVFSVSDVGGGCGRLRVFVISDISHRVAVEKEIAHLAMHDHLTGLANRSLFSDRLEMAMLASRRNGGRVGLVLLDLDNFKRINDTMGHGAGDRLLTQVSGRIRDNVRKSDTVARIGGDEFAIVFPDLGPDEMEGICEKLLVAMESPFDVCGSALGVGFSIGASVCPDHSEDPDDLFRFADAAMYRAKSLGKGCYAIYDEEMSRTLCREMALELALRDMVERDALDEELSIVGQPVYRLDDGGGEPLFYGVEVFCRWNSSRFGGEVPVEEFLSIAEKSHLSLHLGRWVASEAMLIWDRACAGTGMDGFQGMLILNVSAQELSSHGFSSMFLKELRRHRIPAARVVCEFTEDALMRGGVHALENAGALSAAGVRLSLDDFGTGFFSFAQLDRLHLDSLKIDRKIIRGIPGDPASGAVAKTILYMGRQMGLEVIAEGVETPDQAEWLRDAGCSLMQGYFYSCERSFEEVTGLLVRGGRRRVSGGEAKEVSG